MPRGSSNKPASRNVILLLFKHLNPFGCLSEIDLLIHGNIGRYAMTITFSLLQRSVSLISNSILMVLTLGLLALWLAVALVLYHTVVADWFTFEQPRDALRNGHTHHYEQVVELAEAHCVERRCSDEEWQTFFVARDAALQADWSELLDTMLQSWRWRRYSGWGYTLRDDFFRLVEEVGGRDAASHCHPKVQWTVWGDSLNPSFIGLVCEGKLTELTW
jgi:hypothetical protein